MNTGQYTASIVIITYNNWSDTQLCLDSIFAKTTIPEFQVIVIDNASQDGTPDFLQEYANRHPNFCFELNTRNQGFARANNQGAGLAQGEYLVFLNNDTVVTPGWLSGLIHHLQNPRVGMVGPVTNSASNESRIMVDYDSLDDLDEFAKCYIADHAGKAFDIRALAYFCVAMRRAVFDEIGPLDERFGVGMFEDDDYAMRLRERDYQLLCAEDVYVHHSGGKSFLKLETLYYWRLFHSNREKFEEKWSIKWRPHFHRNDLLKEQVFQVSEHSYYLQWRLLDQAHMVQERDQMLRAIRQPFNRVANELDMIYASRTWKLVHGLRRSREVVIPNGSSRELILLKMIGGINWVRHHLRSKAAYPIPPPRSVSVLDEAAPAPETDIHLIKAHDRSLPILAPQFFNFTGDQFYLGGAERYLVELAKLISSLGYQPIVYQSARERWEREYDGIPVIGLPTRGDLQLLNQRFHEEISPSALAIYFAFYLAAPHANVRSIGISHGVYWDVGNDQPLVAQQERIEAVLDPIANLSRVVSVDTNTINWVRGIQSYLAKKFVYIPNFVDLEKFKDVAQQKSDERLIVLYPRRLYGPRGFWLLKEIIPEFIHRYPNIEFHFVGQAEPDAESSVREMIHEYPENVRWYTLQFDEMPQAYQAADITLIPTVNSEGTSLSCLEAMAAGNAVIASNVGGLPDLVISGYNGILIDPSANALRDALNMLCQDQKLRHKFGSRAQEVVQTFNITQWQASWIKILKEYLL